MTTNQAQREQWNDEDQVRNWPKRERISIAATPPLIAKLAPRPGERVLDIGSGGGLAAIEAARAVGDAGHVTGYDISEGLVRLAQQRAADASITNVRFIAGDAQTDDMPGAPFDAAMSQFGVMFFADPVAAFQNIRRHLQPNGRLVFASWQPAANNAWFPMPVMAKYAPRPAAGAPPPGAPATPPPGPFAFGDPGYVRSILTGAGFTAIEHEAIYRDVTVPEDSLFDREFLKTMRLEGERADAAWNDLQEYLAPFRIGDGRIHIRLAPQLFAAKNSA
jgi:SAM-dependent methyltransferase